jgi:hypothetical protein
MTLASLATKEMERHAGMLPPGTMPVLLSDLAKFAQQPAAGTNMEAQEELASLQEFLMGWMDRNNLSRNPGAAQFVSSVMKTLGPALEQAMKTSPSLEEQLKAVPKIGPAHKTPSQEGVVDKGMLGDVSPVPKAVPPQVVRQRQRASHGGLAKLSARLATAAGKADAAGILALGDRLDSMARKVGIVRLAQYEGFQHYWIMNGRAFEKSWKEKRKKRQSDDLKYHFNDEDYFRSANECWWETLEEYQDSLMGEHEAWLEKFAGRRKRRKAKETEEGSAGTGGPSPMMSGKMKEFHDEMSGDDEMSEGERWSKWLDDQSKKAAGTMLMERVASKMASGSEPGVALYESIDEVVSGSHVPQVVAEAETLLAEAETLLAAGKQEGMPKGQ